jgi:hypothetical protein
MNAGKRYGINEGEVVAQTFDDETVIINLARGYYYSVTGTASRMWALLCGGFTVEETAGAIAQAYGVDRQKVGADVQGLLDKLLQNSLVVESDAVPSGDPDTTPGGAYEAPDIVVHDDIGHLLALDPPVASLQRSLEQQPGE